MPFSDKIKIQAFKRAGGRCECCRKQCFHDGRCQNSCGEVTFFDNYKMANGEVPYDQNKFDCHHKTAESVGGEDILSNCEFLCKECHKQTESYGRHSV